MLGEIIDNLEKDKGIIDIIYNHQEDNNIIDEKTMKILKELYHEEARKYQLIKEIIEKNIVDVNERTKVLDYIEEYKELFRDETSYQVKQYYEKGFKSGVSIMIESLI